MVWVPVLRVIRAGWRINRALKVLYGRAGPEVVCSPVIHQRSMSRNGGYNTDDRHDDHIMMTARC
ncbi:hypothetical protein NBG4_1070009 [Candidatus Sulfobium mesophilum]|uniref:Uncharacterized protein n=1 Tax=Candidatus Sulfobium mesophilum TaxID=2016548 RepID=A0A2U3QEB7_9BACT|nr:hypothetical protein NBG4_1070009 [Candidatus Sulfobium mesophilum]